MLGLSHLSDNFTFLISISLLAIPDQWILYSFQDDENHKTKDFAYLS